MVNKVLFFSAFTPHEMTAAEKNTKIMLKKFDENISVDFVCFKYKNDPDYIPESKNVRLLKRLHNSKLFKLGNVILLPFIHYFYSARFNIFYLFWLKHLVKNGDYDFVVFDHSQLFLYAKYLGGRSHKILIAHDVMLQKVMRSTHLSFAVKLCRISEGYAIRVKNSQLFTFSQKDCDLFEQYYRVKARCTFDYLDERIARCKPNQGDYFVMFGNWGRMDNLGGALWLINEVLPSYDKSCRIVIIGKGFPKEKVTLNSEKVSLEIMGFVDDPYPIISGSKALLSPLFSGAGIKVKVIESLACGVPVIGTEIAFEGIPVEYERFMIHAEDGKSFIRNMNEINYTPEERLSFKEFFAKHFQNETIPEYIKAYEL